MRLTDFLGVSRECDEISWDPAKSNQFLTLDFFVNFIAGKSVSASFQNIICQNFLGEHAPRPPRTGLNNFSRRCAARTFLPRNLTLNSYNKLANTVFQLFYTSFLITVS